METEKFRGPLRPSPEELDAARLLLFLFRLMKEKNVDKLVNAGLVDLADLSQKDQQLINSLSDDEVNAVISGGSKVLDHAKSGEKAFKVTF